MRLPRDIALVDELRALPNETAWLEFKGNNSDPNMIGKRCAALSNAARIEGRDLAYMVWGVEDGSHAVVGTDFNPDGKKVGSQPLPLWLANALQPSIAFSFRTVEHPQGRLVLLEIPAATGAPVAFNGVPYIRIGSATPRLADYLDRYQQLIERLRPYRWEQGAAVRQRRRRAEAAALRPLLPADTACVLGWALPAGTPLRRRR
jgi:ATP-dependent DNA helicase RecG